MVGGTPGVPGCPPKLSLILRETARTERNGASLIVPRRVASKIWLDPQKEAVETASVDRGKSSPLFGNSAASANLSRGICNRGISARIEPLEIQRDLGVETALLGVK